MLFRSQDAVSAWLPALLDASKPVASLEGVPVVWSGDPEATLVDLGLGDSVEVTITDGSLTYVLEPVVDRRSWNPVTGKVSPTWVLGGRRSPDPLGGVVAELRASRAERRRATPTFQPELGLFGGYNQEVSFTGGDLTAPSVSATWWLPGGVWAVFAYHTCPGASSVTTTVDIEALDYTASGASDVIIEATAGPSRVVVTGGYAGGTPTTRKLRCIARRLT